MNIQAADSDDEQTEPLLEQLSTLESQGNMKSRDGEKQEEARTETPSEERSTSDLGSTSTPKRGRPRKETPKQPTGATQSPAQREASLKNREKATAARRAAPKKKDLELELKNVKIQLDSATSELEKRRTQKLDAETLEELLEIQAAIRAKKKAEEKPKTVRVREPSPEPGDIEAPEQPPEPPRVRIGNLTPLQRMRLMRMRGY